MILTRLNYSDLWVDELESNPNIAFLPPLRSCLLLFLTNFLIFTLLQHLSSPFLQSLLFFSSLHLLSSLFQFCTVFLFLKFFLVKDECFKLLFLIGIVFCRQDEILKCFVFIGDNLYRRVTVHIFLIFLLYNS